MCGATTGHSIVKLIKENSEVRRQHENSEETFHHIEYKKKAHIFMYPASTIN
jgi:hypothetical protein